MNESKNCVDKEVQEVSCFVSDGHEAQQGLSRVRQEQEYEAKEKVESEGAETARFYDDGQPVIDRDTLLNWLIIVLAGVLIMCVLYLIDWWLLK